MGLVRGRRIAPATVATIITGHKVLQDISTESTQLNQNNTRSEWATLDHLNVTRSPTLSSFQGTFRKWADEVFNGAATSVHSSTTYAVVNTGSAMELTPPAGSRGNLSTGHVCRWHFSCEVESVGGFPTPAPSDDAYLLIPELRLTVVATTVDARPTTSSLLGIPFVYGMNQGNNATVVAPAVNKPISENRIQMSGVYIHNELSSDNPTGVQGVAHVDRIRIYARVANALNTVTLKNASLFAYIGKP